jgi:aerobic-type carbon monoxide dehydrogenase small subunit (CoxS/CutS family)
MTTLKINGKSVDVDVDPATPLLWVLRDVIGLPAPSLASAWPFAAPAQSI